MTNKELKQLIEQIIKEETLDPNSKRKVGMSNNYLFKEQIMKMVQDAVLASVDSVGSQEDYSKTIESEIESIKADMDMTFDMVKQTLNGIPFEIFFKAMSKK